MTFGIIYYLVNIQHMHESIYCLLKIRCESVCVKTSFNSTGHLLEGRELGEYISYVLIEVIKSVHMSLWAV